jgi:tRNA threonylcarbamoyladenosine biosynthesis protein TsaB
MLSTLGFDSAGAGASAAILRGDRIVAERVAMERGQAETLIPLIGDVLVEAGLDASELDLIAVTVGPGSFTGLRIAIATARGLSSASGVPALGISSFDAVAAQVESDMLRGRHLLVALDTKRDDFYLQVYDEAEKLSKNGALLSPSAIAAWLPAGRFLVAGDAAGRVLPFLTGLEIELCPGSERVRAADVARLAAARWRPGDRADSPRPVYLRAPDVRLPPARPH